VAKAAKEEKSFEPARPLRTSKVAFSAKLEKQIFSLEQLRELISFDLHVPAKPLRQLKTDEVFKKDKSDEAARTTKSEESVFSEFPFNPLESAKSAKSEE
jgi:hypothetical protein